MSIRSAFLKGETSPVLLSHWLTKRGENKEVEYELLITSILILLMGILALIASFKLPVIKAVSIPAIPILVRIGYSLLFGPTHRFLTDCRGLVRELRSEVGKLSYGELQIKCGERLTFIAYDIISFEKSNPLGAEEDRKRLKRIFDLMSKFKLTHEEGYKHYFELAKAAYEKDCRNSREYERLS